MNKRLGALLLFIFLSTPTLIAQTGGAKPQVSIAFAVLTSAVEAKSATAGQEISLRTLNDVVAGGAVVIPNGSKLTGRVTEVNLKGKGVEQTELYIVIDKAVIKSGAEIPLQAIIAAVAAPQNGDLTSDPTYGMLHSNETKMGGGAGSMSKSGSLTPASTATSASAVATANLKGRMDEPLVLNETSQGAVGYEGLSLSWHLMAPPPVTVFAAKSSNIKLKAGTQVLLRMATPNAPR